jgi:hypothetical protein
MGMISDDQAVVDTAKRDGIAVLPIHHMRRDVTASYMTRGELSAPMTERIVAERERRVGSLDHVPEDLRPYYAVD